MKKGCRKPAQWLCTPDARQVWPRLEGQSEHICGDPDFAYPTSPYRPVQTAKFWFCDDCIVW